MNLAAIRLKLTSLLGYGPSHEVYLPMDGVESTGRGSNRSVKYPVIFLPAPTLSSERWCAAVSVRGRVHVAHSGTPAQSDAGSVSTGILCKCAGAPDLPAGTSSARGGVQMARMTQPMDLIPALRYRSAVLPAVARDARPTVVD